MREFRMSYVIFYDSIIAYKKLSFTIYFHIFFNNGKTPEIAPSALPLLKIYGRISDTIA